jgi:hypothetical protein
MKAFFRLAPTLVLALSGCADPSSEGAADDSELAQTADDSEQPGPATYGLTLDDDSVVVASFDAPDGRQVKFLESDPGVVTIMQAGRIGSVLLVSAREMETLRPADLYERISGKKAPAKLLAASRRMEALRSEQGETTPSTQAENGAESPIGVSSQALHNFDDSWLFSSTQGCAFGQTVIRGGTTERDLYNSQTPNGGWGTVYNTGVEAKVTGHFKYRNSFTWSGGTSYSLDPNFYVDFRIRNNGLNVRYDIKTYVKPNGSSYTACQYRI